MNQFSDNTLIELKIIKRELDEAMIYALVAIIGQKAILRKAGAICAICEFCGNKFYPKQSDAKTCGNRCRVALAGNGSMNNSNHYRHHECMLSLSEGVHYAYGCSTILITGCQLFAQTDLDAICKIHATRPALITAGRFCILETYDNSIVHVLAGSVVYIDGLDITVDTQLGKFGCPGSKKNPLPPPAVIRCCA
ncbi:MAG: hypothetical protein PHI13_08960 [Methylococcales bacterium]|nr:hypothetical protein [Methylococcales bacterium]